MVEQNIIYPIDSRFIFKLIQYASNQKNKNKLYRLLLLKSNDGQSFAGTSNRVKYCWWPDHASFFYNALRLQDEGIGLEIDLTCGNNQKFPLPQDLLQWSIIAQEINKKINNPEVDYHDLEFRENNMLVAEDVEDQLTFESHVFNVLSKSFDRFATEKEKIECVSNFCKTAKIPQYEINRINETEKFDDILVHIITRATENAGSPLTVPITDDNTGGGVVKQDWQILAANELKMDPMEVSARVMENDKDLYHELPDSVAGNQRQWADVFVSFPSFCRFLVDPNGEIQGNFSAVGLTKEQERKMAQGRFVDSEIDICFCDPLHTPGDHVLYLLNLSVNREVESEHYYALWNELVALLQKCAKEGVYFTKIYYKAFVPEHRAMVIGRGGFRFLCYDAEYGAVFVHEMNPATTLRVMDEELASLYRERKSQKGRLSAASNDELEAEIGFRNMFKMIDELFRNPRLAEMKPYFFSNVELPKNEKQRQLGIATAELLRDILQYAKSLLEYLNEDFTQTYNDYCEMIMASALVRAGIEQYQFATEHPDFKLKKLGIDQVNAKDIVNFAMIWIEMDKLFVMQEDVLKLRPFFYELRDSLPNEDEIHLATALVVRLLSAMKIAESLLDRIPNYLVVSYYTYKKMVKSIRIVQEVVEQNQFIKEELGW